MKKYGDREKIEVAYEGKEAAVVHDHLLRTGKALGDFDKDELAAFNKDLKEAKAEVEEEKADEKDEV